MKLVIKPEGPGQLKQTCEDNTDLDYHVDHTQPAPFNTFCVRFADAENGYGYDLFTCLQCIPGSVLRIDGLCSPPFY